MRRVTHGKTSRATGASAIRAQGEALLRQVLHLDHIDDRKARAVVEGVLGRLAGPAPYGSLRPALARAPARRLRHA